MTAVADAITKAGIAPPVTRRIWQYLKDTGPRTPHQVFTALHIKQDTCRSLMLRMWKGGMLDRKDDSTKQGIVTTYSALGSEYILKFHYTKRTNSKTAPSSPQVMSTALAVIEKPWHPEDLLNKLSFKQGLELYKYLKGNIENV